LYYVHDGVAVPGYGTRFVAFTLATLAALAFDLWNERRKASRHVGETP
jgi:hypothetical protein